MKKIGQMFIAEHGELLDLNPNYLPYIENLDRMPRFGMDDNGNLYGLDKQDNLFIICNFVAKPVQEIIRDDGVEEKRTIVLEGILEGGVPLQKVQISIDDFLQMSWITKKWGISAIIRAGHGNKDFCREAIQVMGSDIEKISIYTHLGWRKLLNGQWCYLHGNGAIGAQNVSVEIEQGLERYSLPDAVGDSTLAIQSSLRLLEAAPFKVTIPMLAFIYLSPLCELFRQVGIEPSFVMWVYGGTGTRKSSLSLLMLSHFGDFGTKSPPSTFKDTVNAIERKAFILKDAPLLIDDFYPGTSFRETNQMNQVAQGVLRMYGDRIGKGRLTSNIEAQKTLIPRGTAIITGEDLPDGHSSVARLFKVELGKDYVNLEKLTIAQTNAERLQESMKLYLEWLIPQMEELPIKMKELFLEKRAEFQKRSQHGRLGESAAWLYVAWTLFLRFSLEMKACPQQMVERLTERAQNILNDGIDNQNQLIMLQKPADLFLEILAELFMSGKIYLEPLSEDVSSVYSSNQGQNVGWVDEEFLYLLKGVVYNLVNQFLMSRGRKFPGTENSLWKSLDENGIIHTEKNSAGSTVQYSPKKLLSNGDEKVRMRVLHLHREKMDELLK